MTLPAFSVLISVYEKDNPEHFKLALQSVIDQTVSPGEILLIGDGPLTDSLHSVIDDFRSEFPDIVRIVQLETNQGLGTALQTGVEECTHKIVARMDADDVAVNDRFERQLKYLSSNPDVDVVGGSIGEFRDDPEDIVQVREVPIEADEVESFARFRCPTNHPTVMFRRDSVLEAGNYRSLRTQQDYELWMRMLSQGYTIENLPEVLVRCRAGEELYDRRGGLEYAQLEYSLQREFLQLGAITWFEFVRNILLRIPIRLVPNRVRSVVYKILLRK
ncbi:family 2 glycosyl transferase [Natrinema pallidum DSM 3751]|uniref:Family 2 glycosyl transferase n=1 Tax=Natrinema pallidum DSM 3751 TaxID=1227495 RepID=L9Z1W4_9EURY|nr:glycosyltransferase [Natrinema pallidum]ELY79682.1 family 2 glycosyl transferase [Natrinema pallidum DSM 3751]